MTMSNRVLCLRPEADFPRVGVSPPATLAIRYAGPADACLAALVRAADALLIPAVGPKLTPELFEGAPTRLVQVTGAGVDRLDQAAMRRLGIAIANVPGGSNSAVAEYAVAAALTVMRRLAWSSAEIKAGRYAEMRSRMVADNLTGLEGLTVGVVGLGTIGMAVAAGFAAHGSRIVYFDPAPREPAAAAQAGYLAVTLDQLIATSDVVTLHVPLLPATTSLIGPAQLAAMKPSAVLINAARGGIVDEAALAATLAAGKLAGAAVDVYSTEPPTADNPLLALSGDAAQRLLLTPHIAGVTRQSWATLFATAWDNVERVLLRGEPPLNEVG